MSKCVLWPRGHPSLRFWCERTFRKSWIFRRVALKYLPRAFEKAVTTQGSNCHLRGDIALATSSGELVYRSSYPSFCRTVSESGWHKISSSGGWTDASFALKQSMKEDEGYTLIVRSQTTVSLRLALLCGTLGSIEGEFDLWGEFPKGLTFRTFRLSSLTRRKGVSNFDNMTLALFGGPAFTGLVEFGLFDSKGALLLE